MKSASSHSHIFEDGEPLPEWGDKPSCSCPSKERDEQTLLLNPEEHDALRTLLSHDVTNPEGPSTADISREFVDGGDPTCDDDCMSDPRCPVCEQEETCRRQILLLHNDADSPGTGEGESPCSFLQSLSVRVCGISPEGDFNAGLMLSTNADDTTRLSFSRLSEPVQQSGGEEETRTPNKSMNALFEAENMRDSHTDAGEIDEEPDQRFTATVVKNPGYRESCNQKCMFESRNFETSAMEIAHVSGLDLFELLQTRENFSQKILVLDSDNLPTVMPGDHVCEALKTCISRLKGCRSPTSVCDKCVRPVCFCRLCEDHCSANCCNCHLDILKIIRTSRRVSLQSITSATHEKIEKKEIINNLFSILAPIDNTSSVSDGVIPPKEKPKVPLLKSVKALWKRKKDEISSLAASHLRQSSLTDLEKSAPHLKDEDSGGMEKDAKTHHRRSQSLTEVEQLPNMGAEDVLDEVSVFLARMKEITENLLRAKQANDFLSDTGRLFLAKIRVSAEELDISKLITMCAAIFQPSVRMDIPNEHALSIRLSIIKPALEVLTNAYAIDDALQDTPNLSMQIATQTLTKSVAYLLEGPLALSSGLGTICYIEIRSRHATPILKWEEEFNTCSGCFVPYFPEPYKCLLTHDLKTLLLSTHLKSCRHTIASSHNSS